MACCRNRNNKSSHVEPQQGLLGTFRRSRGLELVEVFHIQQIKDWCLQRVKLYVEHVVRPQGAPLPSQLPAAETSSSCTDVKVQTDAADVT